MREGNTLRFIQMHGKYLKVSIGNDVYNLTKYDKIQLTSTTIIFHPNTGVYLLQSFITKGSDKNGLEIYKSSYDQQNYHRLPQIQEQ